MSSWFAASGGSPPSSQQITLTLPEVSRTGVPRLIPSITSEIIPIQLPVSAKQRAHSCARCVAYLHDRDRQHDPSRGADSSDGRFKWMRRNGQKQTRRF